MLNRDEFGPPWGDSPDACVRTVARATGTLAIGLALVSLLSAEWTNIVFRHEISSRLNALAAIASANLVRGPSVSAAQDVVDAAMRWSDARRVVLTNDAGEVLAWSGADEALPHRLRLDPAWARIREALVADPSAVLHESQSDRGLISAARGCHAGPCVRIFAWSDLDHVAGMHRDLLLIAAAMLALTSALLALHIFSPTAAGPRVR